LVWGSERPNGEREGFPELEGGQKKSGLDLVLLLRYIVLYGGSGLEHASEEDVSEKQKKKRERKKKKKKTEKGAKTKTK